MMFWKNQQFHVVAVALIACCASIEFWFLLCFFILPHAAVNNVLSNQVVGEWQFMVRFEQEAFVYRGFVLTSIILCAGLVLWLSKKLEHEAVKKNLMAHAAIAVVTVMAMATAAFKIIVYSPRVDLAKKAMLICFVLGIFAHLTFNSWGRIKKMKFSLRPGGFDAIVGVMLGVILFIPDLKAVVARMFLGEQVHHFDSAIAAPGWAFLSGLKLNVDVISQYGLGLPIFVALKTKVFGGFSYEHALLELVLGAIVYFIIWYVFLRLWMKDQLLSTAAVILALTTQMFHAGSYPIAFTYPSTTVWRFLFDGIFFITLYFHIKTARPIFLLLAGALVGLAFFHMTTTGLCLGLTLVGYMFIHGVDVVQHKAKLHKICWAYAACLGIGLVTLMGLLWVFIGSDAFTTLFWQKMGEFNHYFLSGFGAEPMEGPLQKREIFAGILGFVIPVFLMLVVIAGLGLLFLRRLPKMQWLTMLVAGYGLLLFHYYVGRAVSANVFVVAIPPIIVGFALLRHLLLHKKGWKIALFAVVILNLITNHLFLAYPNVINLVRDPVINPKVFSSLPDGRSYFNHLFSLLPNEGKFPLNSLNETDEGNVTEENFESQKQLGAYFDREFSFAKDAAMIDRLVPPSKKAAIISSFETQFLIKSNRQPFFYYTPIIISRPLRMRTFAVTALYTTGHLQRTLDLISQEKPAYIFVERIFNKDNITRANYKDGSAFLALMKYVHAYYEQAEEGEFLMALKRR